MKINILDSSVYNLISAGEVVENPTSVVKEVVENSIDAGATSVTVKIENGGIKFIEITDNGFGIPKEEIHKTILPHATGKLETAEDLSSISTLGFRGEALASISAISDYEIVSKFVDDEYGTRLTSIAGKIIKSDCAANQGTIVRVSNLFHNTPARYKFLKKPQYETAAVTALISQLILSNPNVAFKYYADNKLMYASSGTGLESAIISVYGEEAFAKFLTIIDTNDSYMKVTGYIGKPEFVKGNRTNQTIIINGRVITDQSMSATVLNAYGERIMKHNFPIFVLNIVMPFDEVDINVHPNKKEVRFANARRVYASVYRSVFDTLDYFETGVTNIHLGSSLPDGVLGNANGLNASWAQRSSECATNATNNRNVLIKYSSPPSKHRMGERIPDFEVINPKLNLEIREDLANKKSNLETNEQTLDQKLDLEIVRDADTKAISEINENTVVQIKDDIHSGQENMDYYDPIIHSGQPLFENNNSENYTHSGQSCVEFDSNTKNYTVIGQIFSTYLIIEVNEKMYIIDQHAVHERLLYNELKMNVDKRSNLSQPLLVPYLHHGDRMEISRLVELIPELNEIGFDIEEFGGDSIKVNAVPNSIGTIRLENFMCDVASQYLAKNISNSSIIRDSLMLTACKAAIKGGCVLSKPQIEQIVETFLIKGIPLTCPHGRPTYITYTKAELEKLFRRRV
ncbi:MAG: DNA mismatch repair endonuclease MutL [Christensenellaceae bacterium]|jgi:DNA mismatch repair protein MutL|nr:DNA mismatch repair endonuclease MutL [Christensenellaceae bacterium]